MIALQILCSRPPEAHNEFANPASFTLPLAPGTWRSQGTVISSKINCLVKSETMIMSGQSCVDIILVGIFSRLPRSTSSCQSVAVVRRSDFALGCGWTFSPVLRNLMVLALDGIDGCGYALSNCLKDLVMAPAIAAISKGFWSAAKEVF